MGRRRRASRLASNMADIEPRRRQLFVYLAAFAYRAHKQAARALCFVIVIRAKPAFKHVALIALKIVNFKCHNAYMWAFSPKSRPCVRVCHGLVTLSISPDGDSNARNGIEQAPGFSMLWRLQNRAGCADLDNTALMHDGDPVCQILHHAKIMGNEQIGNTEFSLQRL